MPYRNPERKRQREQTHRNERNERRRLRRTRVPEPSEIANGSTPTAPSIPAQLGMPWWAKVLLLGGFIFGVPLLVAFPRWNR